MRKATKKKAISSTLTAWIFVSSSKLLDLPIDNFIPDATGSISATFAILIIYYIFVLSPQAKQGADILAFSDSSRQYQVFMPDFFYGKPAEKGIFPPDTEEKKKKLGAFLEGPANPSKTAEKIPDIIKEISKQRSTIEKWGVVGGCWGGKVIELLDGMMDSALG